MDYTLGDDLIPKYFFHRLTDVTPDDLRRMGAKAVGLDIDNTMAWDSTYTLFPGVRDWVRRVREAGFPVVIVTNTYEHRAKSFSKKLGGVPYISKAGKPGRACFEKAAAALGVELGEFAMFGDQLFTDVKGANLSGAIAVRVRPRAFEALLAVHYLPLRRLEHRFLTDRGFADKI